MIKRVKAEFSNIELLNKFTGDRVTNINIPLTVVLDMLPNETETSESFINALFEEATCTFWEYVKHKDTRMYSYYKYYGYDVVVAKRSKYVLTEVKHVEASCLSNKIIYSSIDPGNYIR